MKKVGEVYWANPIEEGLYLDDEIVKKLIKEYKAKNIELINDRWQQDNFYIELEDEAEYCTDIIHKKIKDKYANRPNIISDDIVLMLVMEDHKENSNSIAYEIVELLSFASLYRFTQSDFEAMEEFLATSRGKELEGWAKWEEYWQKREE